MSIITLKKVEPFYSGKILYSVTIFSIIKLHTFKRVIEKARCIEIYFKVPEDMRIHSKSATDLKNKVSHTILFKTITIATTAFWIFFMVFCIWRY